MAVDLNAGGAAASALVGALFHHLWEATLFGGAVLVLLAVAEGLPARLRCALVMLAAGRFLVPSAWLEAVLTAAGLDGLAAELANAVFPAPLSHWLPALAEGPRGVDGGLPPAAGAALACGWLLGAVCFLSRFVARRRLVGQGLSGARPLDTGREAEILARLAARLRLPVPVVLGTSAALQAPAVWGIRRPVLVLPVELGEQLTTAELELLLLHELLHVRRRDNLVAVLHRLLCCLLWFHPLLWLLERRLLAERERAVDEGVVRWAGTGELYARSLVKALRLGLGLPLLEAAAVGGGALGARLGRIRGAGRRPWARRLAQGVAAAGLAFLGFFSLLPLPSVMCLRVHRDRGPALVTASAPAASAVGTVETPREMPRGG